MREIPELNNWIVFGYKGQLGKTLVNRLSQQKIHLLDLLDYDFTDPINIIYKLNEIQPSGIINAAGYTNIDGAEDEEQKALLINVETPKQIALWCQLENKPLVHFSTNHVYSGMGAASWHEDDIAVPINTYGKTKLLGDSAISKSGCRHLIFRSSMVYTHTGINLFTKTLEKAKTLDRFEVVTDQVGSPTYADDFVDIVIKTTQLWMLYHSQPSGVYNLCNDGEVSKFDFVREILLQAKDAGLISKLPHVIPIKSADKKYKARRPMNGRLNTKKFLTTFRNSLPHWRAGLRHCIADAQKKP